MVPPGKEKSFSEIFNQLYPALCLFAFRITRDQAVSEDIAEESFLKIWDRRQLFYQFTNLKSYLYTTVRNECFRYLKTNKEILSGKKEITSHCYAAQRSILEATIEAELFREINALLENLPTQSRKIMKMIFFEGKKTRQVAAELGLSPSTVKTQKTRALKKLKNNLSPP